MSIEERIKLYRVIFEGCKAIELVQKALNSGYEQATPLQRLSILRDLDTDLAECYKVWIPVITCWVRDDNYVSSTKEIYLGEPDIEGFLHQFRHHLQNEAREQGRRYLLVEESKDIDYKTVISNSVHTLYGEDDAIAWSGFLLDECGYS